MACSAVLRPKQARGLRGLLPVGSAASLLVRARTSVRMLSAATEPAVADECKFHTFGMPIDSAEIWLLSTQIGQCPSGQPLTLCACMRGACPLHACICTVATMY